MPLYEYECQSCGEHVERIQRVDDAPLSECPKCGGPLRRLLGVPALQFKGSGWYVTDYGNGNGKGEAASPVVKNWTRATMLNIPPGMPPLVARTRASRSWHISSGRIAHLRSKKTGGSAASSPE